MTTILMYHQIAELSKEQDPLGLSTPPAQFEQQMDYLARNGYTCLTLAEAVQYFKQGERTPSRSFVLTFDDGYQDLFSVIRPILEKHGFTATVFLVAGRMGLMSNWQGQDKERASLLLSKTEAQELVRHGFIFGSHTISHPFLRTLDERSVLEEIRRSKALLQENLKVQVDYFSYPYSQTDDHIEDLVRSAGYKAACAGDVGPWSLFHLWRVPCVSKDTPLSFAFKVSGLYERRTALRESAPVQLLRRGVHMIRGKQAASLPTERTKGIHG